MNNVELIFASGNYKLCKSCSCARNWLRNRKIKVGTVPFYTDVKSELAFVFP